jgi:hypothetical protein
MSFFEPIFLLSNPSLPLSAIPLLPNTVFYGSCNSLLMQDNINSISGVTQRPVAPTPHYDPVPPASREPPPTTVEVGIDFGTARSGYAISLNGQNIEIQQQYGEHHNHLQCKTPTLILYDTTCRPWKAVAFGSKAEHM